MELHKLKSLHIDLPEEYAKKGQQLKELEYIYNKSVACYELLKAGELLKLKASTEKMNADEKKAKVEELTHTERMKVLAVESNYQKAKQDLFALQMKYDGVKELGYFYRLESKKIGEV